VRLGISYKSGPHGHSFWDTETWCSKTRSPFCCAKLVRRCRMGVLPVRPCSCYLRPPPVGWAVDRCAAPTVAVRVPRSYPLPASVSQGGVGGGISRGGPVRHGLLPAVIILDRDHLGECRVAILPGVKCLPVHAGDRGAALHGPKIGSPIWLSLTGKNGSGYFMGPSLRVKSFPGAASVRPRAGSWRELRNFVRVIPAVGARGASTSPRPLHGCV